MEKVRANITKRKDGRYMESSSSAIMTAAKRSISMYMARPMMKPKARY